MSILGIILSLALFMLLAYRGVNVVVLAPLMAVVAVLFDPGTPVLASYTQVFMPALGRFVTNFFPLFLLGSICVNLLAGITGSASGGLTIALEALGPTFLERGVAAGVSPEVMHRIAAMSCCGLDTLPHNGAVVTLLIICGLTHWQSYLDIFVVSVLGPIVATVAVLVLATTLGSAWCV
jgi:H+/gluconate symporter-like permease